MRLSLLFAALLVSGCVASTQNPASSPAAVARPTRAPDAVDRQRFVSVVRRVEPVAEQICRRQNPGANCDFEIVIHPDPNAPPNAFQTLDRNGRPILGFTLSLIADVRNADELAFVMSHEAAHHIENHIPRQQQSALAGAVLLGGLAALTGATSAGVDAAVDLGAGVGARSFSKEFELEADALGTVIARRSGYDPVRGAEFFNQIPDPGNVFLGTHPPNERRIETVRRVNAGL